MLATTYTYNLGDCENGKTWSERWHAKDTANCDALKNLGTINFGTDCQKNYLRAVNYFRQALDCYKNVQGMDNCGNSDIILYVAQAYHLHAADLAEADKKQESKQYFKNAFDWYKKVLKCDPGNEAAKQGVRDTEFEY